MNPVAQYWRHAELAKHLVRGGYAEGQRLAVARKMRRIKTFRNTQVRDYISNSDENRQDSLAMFRLPRYHVGDG